MAIEFEVPSLDGVTTDPKELLALADTLRMLANYAETKAYAMDYRATGRIPLALGKEAKCDAIYKTLPQWARW